jgi:N-acetylglucosaminyldiphosphoundecaprenol N-acetyl-beta-D-mannosaminyltransferase
MARMEGWRDRPPRHALFGGAPGVGERLADRLAARFPRSKLVGITVPPMGAWRVEENDAFIEELNGLNPDVIWVGLGAPLQDLWMAEHRGRLTASLLVGVGAAFDFLSGTKPQAPVWMRRAGLEWAFRLASEPRRLGSRYGVTIPRILALGARDLLSPLPPVEGRAQPSLKSDECGP